MSIERKSKKYEALQLPELDYTLALPFGRFMMSKSASASLKIVPLVPSIEEFPGVADGAGNEIDILVATSLDEVTQEQVRAQNMIDKSRPMCLIEVDPPNLESEDYQHAFAEFITGNMPEFDYADVISIRRNIEQGQSQAIVHALADFAARCAAEVYVQALVRRTSNVHTRSVRNSWILTAIGSVGLSAGIDAPFLRAAGIGAVVAVNGYANVKTQKLVDQINSIDSREGFKLMMFDDVRGGVHDAFCAAHADKKLNDLLDQE